MKHGVQSYVPCSIKGPGWLQVCRLIPHTWSVHYAQSNSQLSALRSFGSMSDFWRSSSDLLLLDVLCQLMSKYRSPKFFRLKKYQTVASFTIKVGGRFRCLVTIVIQYTMSLFLSLLCLDVRSDMHVPIIHPYGWINFTTNGFQSDMTTLWRRRREIPRHRQTRLRYGHVAVAIRMFAEFDSDNSVITRGAGRALQCCSSRCGGRRGALPRRAVPTR